LSDRSSHSQFARISEAQLDELRVRGFTIFRQALDPETLAEAQQALWDIFPKPEAFFADPDAPAHVGYKTSQFAGLRNYPYPSWALNRIAVLPSLVDAAERYLQSTNIEVYKAQLWAKYSNGVSYDQTHHRDFGNHSLVVPREDRAHSQMSIFVLLSDVGEGDAPTKVVPLDATRNVPLHESLLPFGDFFDREIAITGRAGDVLIYRTDVVHRGSDFGAGNRSRFVLPIDYQERGWPWNGKIHWGDRATTPGFNEALCRMSVRERDLFGFPPPGSAYWNEQTLRDVGRRYPDMDMNPYVVPVS
jgi:hypothetical protein